MEDGSAEMLTRALYDRLYNAEMKKLVSELGPDAFAKERFPEAAQIFTETATAPVLPDFLTIPAYALLEETLSKPISTSPKRWRQKCAKIWRVMMMTPANSHSPSAVGQAFMPCK